MASKCKYCGSASYGSGCMKSPTKKHEHIDDEKHCVFCGSASYGTGCMHSPIIMVPAVISAAGVEVHR